MKCQNLMNHNYPFVNPLLSVACLLYSYICQLPVCFSVTFVSCLFAMHLYYFQLGLVDTVMCFRHENCNLGSQSIVTWVLRQNKLDLQNELINV